MGVTDEKQAVLTFETHKICLPKNLTLILKKLLAILALSPLLFTSSCNKDDPATGSNHNIIPLQTIVQANVATGSIGNLVILAGSSITNTGATVITGDMGLSPGTSAGGFPPGILNGVLHINDTTAMQAKLDLVTAFNDAANRNNAEIVTLSGNLGGLTLTPGLYKSTSSLGISSGDLTFDARGNPDAVFIIQIGSALTVTSGRQVFLSGGAQAKNIFWQVSSSATFGTTASFAGNVMAMQSITFETGASLTGRALARNGAVTLDGNIIVLP